MANNGKRRVVTGDSNNKKITVTRKDGTVKKQKTKRIDQNEITVSTVKYKRKPSDESKKIKGNWYGEAEVDGKTYKVKSDLTHKTRGKGSEKETKKIVFKGKGVGANNPLKSTKTVYKYPKKLQPKGPRK